MTTAAGAPAHANGHGRPVTLAPPRLPAHGPVSGWPQRDDPGQPRTAADSPGRPRWHADGDMAIRWLTAAVVLAVAAFAAIVSYSHIFELGIRHGQDGTAARLLPLSVDGLIASASLVMLHAARRKLAVPSLARSMLALGVAATIAANIFYGLPFGWLAAVVSAWPAVAFVGSVEMAVRFVRDARQDGGAVQPAAPRVDKPVDKRAGKTAAVDTGKTAAARGQRRTALDKAAAAIRGNPGLADRKAWTELGRLAGVSAKTVQRAANGTGKTPLAKNLKEL